MRQPQPFKRYALARAGVIRRQEEGVKRLRLVRMEAIAELDREREPAPAATPASRM